MSALYQMRYQGVAGNGHGAMYIGKGVVVGIDISGGTVPITFSLPAGFDDGQYHQVVAAGRRVGVAFNKIGDVP